jgi:type I restriction enzyme R subunit
MERIAKMKMPNTKIKLLQQMLKQAIGDLKKVNKVKGMDFTQRFQTLVNKYNERDMDEDGLHNEITDEIFSLISDLKNEMASGDELDISFEEKACYDILKTLAHKYNFEYEEEKLLELSKAVKKLVDDKAKYTDWFQRDDIKAELKMDLIMLLADHGYPPVDINEVYQEVFDQAESYKQHR